MRKLKLLSSLSCLGVLTATVPVVMTGCNDSDKLNIIINTYNTDHNYVAGMTGWIVIEGCTYNDSSTEFKVGSLKATSNSDKVTIDNQYVNSVGIILVSVSDNVQIGETYTIKISAEDVNGHKGETKVDIKITQSKYWLELCDPNGVDTQGFIYFYDQVTTDQTYSLKLYNGTTYVTTGYEAEFNVFNASANYEDWLKISKEPLKKFTIKSTIKEGDYANIKIDAKKDGEILDTYYVRIFYGPWY